MEGSYRFLFTRSCASSQYPASSRHDAFVLLKCDAAPWTISFRHFEAKQRSHLQWCRGFRPLDPVLTRVICLPLLLMQLGYHFYQGSYFPCGHAKRQKCYNLRTFPDLSSIALSRLGRHLGQAIIDPRCNIRFIQIRSFYLSSNGEQTRPQNLSKRDKIIYHSN